MKFEDMKKIWDENSQTYLYVIDENELQKSITRKKSSASRAVNRLEWITILSNAFAAIILVVDMYYNFELPAMILSVYMLATAAYIVIRRRKRLREENNFERSLLGDLQQALSNARYQVALSLLMIVYFIPVALIAWLSLWSGGQSPWILSGAVVFFVVILLASVVEHRKCHVARKLNIEAMLHKLKE